MSLLVRHGVWSIFLWSAGAVCGQSIARVHETNVNSWWTVVVDSPVKGALGFHFEESNRRSAFLDTWYQLQFHPAATWRFSPNMVGTIGYVWMRNGRYGEHPVPHAYVEQRIYAEFRLRQPIGKVELEHRYRFDHRYLQNYTSGDNYYWRRQERVRYQAKLSIPVTQIDQRGRQWLAVGGNEILLHVGPNHGPSIFDQNRLFAGVARRLSRDHKLEVVYMDQFKFLHDGTFAELDHTLRVQLSLGVKMFGRP